MRASVNTQASLHYNATDQPPGLGEIWNCILKGHKSVKKNVKQSEYAESPELRVMACLHKVYE